MAKQDDIGALIESWMQGQQQIWNDWMGAVGKSMGTADASQTWQQGLERWRASMDSTLDAQASAMKSWMEQAGKGAGDSPEARKWATEGEQMVEQWTAAQRRLWEQWFAMMGKLAESAAAQPAADRFKPYLAGWEQVSKQMQSLQQQWAESLAGAAKPASRAGSTKK